MSVLTQVVRLDGHFKRVKRGRTPVIELDLSPGQYVVSVELTKDFDYGDRKTDDWSWTVSFTHPLNAAGAAA